jgi:glycosyltransferase involved in cell wall biosynthesis
VGEQLRRGPIAQRSPLGYPSLRGMGTATPGTGRVSFLLPSLAGGGAARVVLNLAEGLVERGLSVDLVLCRDAGPYREQLPGGVALHVLKRRSRLAARRLAWRASGADWRALARPVLLALRDAPPLPYLGDLADWLRRERPSALIAGKTHTNLVACWARTLSGAPTRLAVTQHSVLSREISSPKGRRWRWRYVAPAVATAYPAADSIVAVSDAVADDLTATTGLARDRIITIYNPVSLDAVAQQARESPGHAWLEPGQPPVVLGVGRLRPSKDFETLLRAFASLRARRPVRLILLGEGSQRDALLALARELGVSEDVALPGFVDNPFAYMGRAGVLALTSRYEALGNVLIEAFAAGCPVVGPRCPGGPRELLDEGRYGALVEPGDSAGFANALETTLDHPLPRATLLGRAAEFTTGRAVDRYLAALEMS